MAAQLKKITELHPENWIVVSSRPDGNLRGLPSFTDFNIRPLNAIQAKRLLELVPFDQNIKTKFASDLDARLFREHASFLSNPLLLSIMLLTYGRSASIPTKLSIFFSKAYEALFEWHDALKGGFGRKRFTDLDVRDFAQAFAAFALLTYDERQLEFTKIDALRIIERSKGMLRMSFDAQAYLKDCLQSVCLLMEDGIDICFAHRSFQEYFVAAFIMESEEATQRRLIKRYLKNIDSDNVMEMLYEMRPALVEKELVLPELLRCRKEFALSNNVTDSMYFRWIRVMISEVVVSNGEIESIRFGNATLYAMMSFINRVIMRAGRVDEVLAIATACKQYTLGNSKKRQTITVGSLTERHPFVVSLRDGQSWLGVMALKRYMALIDALRARHDKREESVDSLLKTDRPKR